MPLAPASRAPVNSSVETQAALRRIGAICAIAGPLVLFCSTLMHPMGEDPNDNVKAFAEYAADRPYVWTHLGQFAGFALIGAALTAFSSQLETGWAAAFGRVGLFWTACSVAVSATLQAVDGVALKAMVDRWAAADGETRAILFEAAFAVRQIEIGLAGLLSLTFGGALLAFGVGLLQSLRFPRWFAATGVVAGLGMLAAGGVQSARGFSGLAMTLSMGASLLALAWGVAMGVLLARGRG